MDKNIGSQLRDLNSHLKIDGARNLRDLLSEGRCLRVIEAHSPMSAVIAEKAAVRDSKGIRSYDAIWSSSLTDSTLKMKPDIEYLDIRHRLSNLIEIKEVTNKPIIMDCDTGGNIQHFELNIAALAKQHISAVILEDKIGLKRNSLFGNTVEQHQAHPTDFAKKLARGKEVAKSSDLMIIARIESLILDKGMLDAQRRAAAYLDAGADGIMIHSRRAEPTEIFEFAEWYKKLGVRIPLVCVPTSFFETNFEELEANGFDIVIYANHLLRASYAAMLAAANGILYNNRSKEIEGMCLPINEIISF